MNKPRVSVVMSAYNAAPFVASAIESILAQTFTDFEFIIVNDGSTDKTPTILKRCKDPRIRIITQSNSGLVASLNTAIATAKAPLIARQDADDISQPYRLKELHAAFVRNSALVLAGSSMSTMNMEGVVINEHHVLLDDAELKQELLVRSPFAHGSTMFKRDAFMRAGGYLQAEWPAEDYGLWLRLAPFGQFANCDAPLYLYRENSGGISSQNTQLQESKKQIFQQAAWRTRKILIPKHIDTAAYINLPDGQLQLERMAQNLLFTLRKALVRCTFVTSFRVLRLLLADRHLRRKCARLVVMKLRFRHA